MSFISDLFDIFPEPRKWREPRPLAYPEPNWPKVVDAEIRLRELELKRQELEVRKLEALAKLEAMRLQKEQVE